MKRDMELMRKILFEIEEEFVAGEGSKFNLKIDGYMMPEIAEHCSLLHEAGLIKNYKAQYADGGLYGFGIGNLTNSGYDYLEFIRNEDVWGKTKATIEEKNLPKTIDNISRVAGTFVGAMLNQLVDK